MTMFTPILHAVGALMLGTTLSQAAIVYFDIPDQTLPLSSNTYLFLDLDGSNSSSRFAVADINTEDLSLWDLCIGNLDVDTVEFTAPWGGIFGNDFPARVSSGTTILAASQPSSPYVGGNAYLEFENLGFWNDTDGTAFVGVTFDPANLGTGDPSTWLHGWVRVTYNDAANTITVLDWAYETTPNTSIIAGAGLIPEPSSIATASLALLGLIVRRRRP